MKTTTTTTTTTIYEKTKTTIKEVLKSMIIKPAHIIIKTENKTKKINLKKYREIKMKDLINYYTYNITFVKNMWYNKHTDILTIETL